MKGKKWSANLTFASTDRIAMDAVGVAALKMHGTTRKIENRAVFEQDQIKRAVELGLGVTNPDDIELVPADEPSEEIVEKIRPFLFK